MQVLIFSVLQVCVSIIWIMEVIGGRNILEDELLARLRFTPLALSIRLLRQVFGWWYLIGSTISFIRVITDMKVDFISACQSHPSSLFLHFHFQS